MIEFFECKNLIPIYLQIRFFQFHFQLIWAEEQALRSSLSISTKFILLKVIAYDIEYLYIYKITNITNK